MSEPKRAAWWLSILSVSVFLLLARSIEIDATETNNETTNATEVSGDENNFEVVDIAQRNEGNEDLQSQTGQTTRIITSQEVDDNFWLKHLGEDFKYAIHIKVDEDSYNNGNHNMTADDINYDNKQEYSLNEVPVQNDKSEEMQNVANELHPENPDNPVLKHTSSENSNDQHNNSTEAGSVEENEIKENEEIYTMQPETDTPPPSTVSRSSSEIQTEENAMQQNGEENTSTTQNNMQHSNEQQQQQQSSQQHEYHQQHQEETQQSHHKKTQYRRKQKKVGKSKNSESNQKKEIPPIRTLWNAPEAAPVVVNLPDDDRTVHHNSADDQTPIVVNMPPVIYHQFLSNEDRHEDKNHTTQQPQNTETHKPPQTHNQYTQNYIQPSLQYGNRIFRQYTPLHAPSFQAPSHYSPYYSSAPQMNEPTIYRNGAVYPSSSYQQPPTSNSYFSTSHTQRQRQKSLDSVRYLLQKTAKPYHEHFHANRIPMENVF